MENVGLRTTVPAKLDGMERVATSVSHFLDVSTATVIRHTSVFVMMDGKEHFVMLLNVMGATMAFAYHQLNAGVTMAGRVPTVMCAKRCRDVCTVVVTPSPIPACATNIGKGRCVTNQNAANIVIMESVNTSKPRIRLNAFVRADGKARLVTNAFLIGNAPTRRTLATYPTSVSAPTIHRTIKGFAEIIC